MKRVGLICPSIRVDDAYRKPAEHLFRASGENIGNFAFVQALHDHLSPHVTTFPWFAPVQQVRERCDIVVMACANQLGPHTNLGALAEWFDKLELPIVAIGLGAQSPREGVDVELREGTLRWLHVMAERAPSSSCNIGVRGEFSRQQVEKAGVGDRAAIIGCPSNFLNPSPNLGGTIKGRWRAAEPLRVAVAAGYYKWPALRVVEEGLVQLLERSDGIYIVQSQLEMIRLSRNECGLVDDQVLDAVRTYAHSSLTIEQFKSWLHRYCWSFNDCSSWMSALQKFGFVVGARFHGVMLALQAGVPGAVITHDSRTTELCETVGIPYRAYDLIPREIEGADLFRLFSFDEATYASRRRGLWSVYRDMLTSADISISSVYDDLAGQDLAGKSDGA